MVAEMRCVTSIYRLELGSESKQEWYLGLSVVGVPKSYRHKIKGHYLISACGVMVNPTLINGVIMQNTKTFSLEIEKMAQEKSITHMDAVLEYCKKKELEPESVTRLISKSLKDKIEANARDLNYLPNQAKLPI